MRYLEGGRDGLQVREGNGVGGKMEARRKEEMEQEAGLQSELEFTQILERSQTSREHGMSVYQLPTAA